MKKILVLFCGGTIVMQEANDGALIMDKTENAIQSLMNLEPKIHDLVKLEVHYIDNIDSTNMNPDHWDRISGVIAEKYNEYDGFVITHGTNTMAYTASALSYALQNLGKPVVLTGAQIPCNRVETDARRNFVNAIRVATLDLAGVAIVFDEEIILGSRASKVSESKLDAFETINWDDLGEIRIDLRLSPEHKQRHDAPLELVSGFENNIAVITIVPGTPPSLLSKLLDDGIKGLILRGYGPGDIAYEYLPVLQAAQNKKIPVVVATQCLEGATLLHLNDVGKKTLDMGVIQAYDMSLESTVTKFMWALKRSDYETIKEIMHTNYTGEINIEGKIY